MSSVYVFGEEYGRHGETTRRFTVDAVDIERAIAIAVKGKDNDAFLEEMTTKYGWKQSTGISVVFYHNNPAKMQEDWKAHRSFGVDYEEGVYGVGNTKEKAKVAYVNEKAVRDGDSDW